MAKDFRGKVQKDYPEFADEIHSLSSDELNGRLARMAKDLEIVEDEKEADEKLNETRAALAELAGPYRDSKKAIKLKSKYIIALLKERGES